jgi:hypothetical protein
MNYLRASFYMLLAGLAVGQGARDPVRYTELSDRIFFHWAPSQDEKTFQFPPSEIVDGITAQLHDIVTTVIEREISQHNVSAASIRKSMEYVQGQYALSSLREPHPPNVPYADIGSINETPTLLTAFAVMRGGGALPEIRAYLRFYSKVTGGWALQAELGHDFNNTMFSVAQVATQLAGEVRYLVWGRLVGNTGAMTTLRLYSFDGCSVRTLWQRDDMSAVTVSISGDRVTLD